MSERVETDLHALQCSMARALADPTRVGELADGSLGEVDADGARLAAVLVARLRFERLVQGSNGARTWFERDPRGFATAFRRYQAAVPPTAVFPSEEARLFAAWRADDSG